MKTFKQFLSEGRGKAVSAEDFIKWANSNCSKYIAGNQHVYRGFTSGDAGITIGNSVGTKPRKSVGGIPNNYTLWIDGHPRFKGFPKRSSSFIASTSAGKAGDFGYPHLMFIKDNDKVADVLTGDIWVKKVLPDMDLLGLNELTETLLHRFDMGRSEKYFELQNALQHVSKRLMRKWYDDKVNLAPFYEDQLEHLLKEMDKRNWDDMWDVWNGLVKPEIFGLTTGANIDSSGSVEVWIEGECGFISLDRNQISEEDKVLLTEWLKDKNEELSKQLTAQWNRKGADD